MPNKPRATGPADDFLPLELKAKGMKVYARRGSMYRKTMGPGVVVGTRLCNLEGCRGLKLITRWPNGKRTMPCTKGMRMLGKQTWEIM